MTTSSSSNPRRWTQHLKTAYREATFSPDPSTQNGALLINPSGDVISRSCNQFPVGVAYTDARWERPLKYSYIEHAERLAIYKAAARGKATRGSTMVCAWAACADCARAIVCADVHTLVRHKDVSDRNRDDHWQESIAIADSILLEAGVEIIEISGQLYNPAQHDAIKVRHNGEVWTP